MAKAKQSRPIYMGWRRLVDPEYGPRMALVAIDSVGRQQLEERAFRQGDRVRVEISQPRHYGNHKFAHKLGTLARNQLPGYELCPTAHDAVKKLQQESGVCCEVTITDVPGVGQLRSMKPKSIAYDSMDESEFKTFVQGICEHIRITHWPSMTAEQIEQMIELHGESA